MTGGIIPNCSKCNDLGKDPNGCPSCNKLGPVGRATRADTAGKTGKGAKNDDVERAGRTGGVKAPKGKPPKNK